MKIVPPPAVIGILSLLATVSSAAAQIEVIPESELSPGAKFAVAIENGDLDKVKALLDSGLKADTKIEYGENSQTPLMKASWDGEAEIAQLLIARGADVNARSEDGGASLFQAVQREHTGIVKLLLDAKADPDIVNTYMQSPLSNAAASGNLEIAELLLKAKAKPELAGPVLTPLMYAAFTGNAEMMRLLVKNGAKVNYATPEYGQTALSSAITAGKPDMVKLLIELKVDVNQKAGGDSPLKLAKNGDQDDVVAMLVAAGAKQ